MMIRPAALLVIPAVLALAPGATAQPTGPDVNYDESRVGEFDDVGSPKGFEYRLVGEARTEDVGNHIQVRTCRLPDHEGYDVS